MEIFEDHTVDKLVPKRHIMIEKREYNPELSVLSNMVLDLVDFKDRVIPLTRELAQAEYAEKHQKHNAQQKQDDKARFMQRIQAMKAGETFVDEGYSSLELESPEDKARAFARKVDAQEAARKQAIADASNERAAELARAAEQAKHEEAEAIRINEENERLRLEAEAQAAEEAR